MEHSAESGGTKTSPDLLPVPASTSDEVTTQSSAALLDEAIRRLRASDERFHALAAASGLIVWTATPDGHLTGDLALWCAFTGRPADDACGSEWTVAVHPREREEAKAAWARAIGARCIYHGENRLRRFDGTYRYVLTRAAPVLTVDGDLLEWVGSCMDITERHLLEETQRRLTQEAAARASELETVIESMADGVAVYDAAGRMVRVNAAGREIFGFDALPPDYSMRPMRERLRLLGLLAPNGQPLTENEWPITRLLRGEVLRGATAADFVRRMPDGREIAINLSGAPLRDAEGRVTGVVAIARDVTDRRQIEQRTHATLDALLAMAAALVEPQATTGADAAGGAEDAPEDMPAEPLQSSSEHTVARRLAELTCSVLGCRRVGIAVVEPSTQILRPLTVVGLDPGQERQWWVEQEQQQTRLGEGGDPAMMARFLAGEVLVLDLSQPPYDTLPNPYGITTMLAAPMQTGDDIVGVLTLDYSGEPHQFTRHETLLAGAVAKLAALVVERERLLRETAAAEATTLALQEAKRRMDEFLSMASHEMKNPLAAIKLNTQLATRRLAIGAEGIERARDLLNRAERQLNRLTRLVDDLLDVSRIQAGKLEMRPETTSLAAIIREVVEEQRQSWPARTITLAPLSKQYVLIHADADRIGQVVTNYLTNALKYSPETSPVEVHLRVRGGCARVSVCDEGPGLPAEEHERIWDRFHRAEGIEAVGGGDAGGLGLGLHISKTIIEWHGGQVGVESAPGQGSTFWFTLPIQRDRPA